jgi:ATP-dependent Clp protease adaptor protein ClpS
MGNGAREVKTYMGLLLKSPPPRCNIKAKASREGRRARDSFQRSVCFASGGLPMSQDDIVITPKTRIKTKVDKPKLYKVILFNDDYTPREFVQMVVQAVFKTGNSVAYRIMITAHQKGSCVVAVYAKDIAETKVKEAMDYAKEAGFPLMFTAEPEE